MIHLYFCAHPNLITHSHMIFSIAHTSIFLPVKSSCCGLFFFFFFSLKFLKKSTALNIHGNVSQSTYWQSFPLACCWCWFSHLVVSNYFATPRTVTCQASLSMEFPRQEYRSGQSFPSPGDLPDSRIDTFPASEGGIFTTELTGKPFPSLHTGKENFWVASYVIFSPFRNGMHLKSYQ